jgi:LPS-assembly protein
MLDKRIIETLAGLEYDAGCWQTRTVAQRINTATSDTVYALFFQIELGGIASIGMNPMEIIERSIPGYMQTRLIPSTYKQQYYE